MINIFQSVVLCLAVFGSLAHAKCPQANGTYPISGSCDAYVECKNGVEEEKLCPDGLLYDEKSTGYPCAYPIDVECTQKQARLQSPQSTDECPHQFGYFRMGDSKNCGQFKNCASGRGFVLNCPDGLAWNPETYRCDWPDQVEDCDAEAFLGFRCPGPDAPKSALLGEQEVEYEFYESKDDCQLYFICVEGRPRRIGCGEDQAFNPETKSCDAIENVSSCSAEVRQRGEAIKAARLASAKAKKSSSFEVSKRASAADSQCPEPDGRFASAEQCDVYTECVNGIAEEKLCPDGLLFHQRTKSTGECIYAPLTTCKERTRLQPANATEHCPRQFGFYPMGDSSKCREYLNCAHGVATLTKCPEGLAFNVQTYQCDWPDLVAECDAEAYLGFTCPPAAELSEEKNQEVDTNLEGELGYFRHPNTCKKYFVCVHGHPRLYNCGKYLAFSVETKSCDYYRNVPECYARLPDVRKKAAAAAAAAAAASSVAGATGGISV